MIAPDFSHVNTWVFDLDHTLYPPSDNLFAQIEERMRRYIMRVLGVSLPEADRLRADYWRRYGTTLAGLMAEHQIDPEPFMIDVHDVDMSHMTPAPALAQAIARLPGRHIIYTNGSRPYAKRVLAARGLSAVFDDVFGVEHAGYVPKPQAAAFEAVFQKANVPQNSAAMFEDDTRNLMVPHQMGLRTVLVGPPEAAQLHVHHQTEDLTRFLSQVSS